MKTMIQKHLRMAAAIGVLGGMAAAASGQCTPAWSTMNFPFPAVAFPQPEVATMMVIEEENGPVLYVGGAGLGSWNGIGKYELETHSWTPLEGGGFFGTVESLAVFDDGTGPALYAGGSFSSPASRIAKWNGESWSAVGVGVGLGVHTLCAFNGSLYAGGTFTALGDGTPASRIARWNGSSWSTLGSGASGGIGSTRVYAQCVFDDGTGPALYVAGNFTSPGSMIAKWNGSTWSTLGSGLNDWVWALCVYDDGTGDALYAAGNFTTAGGQSANRIAKWNGATWSPLGSGPSNGVNGVVRALAVVDDLGGGGPALYAAGLGGITSAGGVPVQGIARWDGTSWSAVGCTDCGVSGGLLYRALVAHNNDLYMGGTFSSVGDTNMNHVAKWGGCEFTGACCFGSGCFVTTEASCVGNGWVYRGNDVACDPDPCSAEPATGACCFGTGCIITTEANCLDNSWVYLGDDVACDPDPCSAEPATGACCNGTICAVSTQADCELGGGVYQGDDVACGDSGNPTTCCRANFDGAGGVAVPDIFAFLSAWFGNDPSADIDGVPGIQVPDIFAFLSLWFAGCPG